MANAEKLQYIVSQSHEKTGNKLQQYKNDFLLLGIFSIILYSFFMTHQLTGVGDGFWHQSYYQAGGWEIGCGRWLWPVWDRFLHGIHVDPYQTLLSLALMIAGYIMILDLFDLNNSRFGIMTGFVYFSSPFICTVLSYRFMSGTFAVSFLFSVLSIYSLIRIRHRWVSFLLASGFMCLSLGMYQAYVGNTALLGVVWALLMLADPDKKLKDLFFFIFRLLGCVLCGGILYSVIQSIVTAITDIELSDYNGAGGVSPLAMIGALPDTLPRALRIFWKYLQGEAFKHNTLLPHGLAFFLLIVFILMSTTFCVCLFKKELLRGCLAIVGLLITPIAVNAMYILAPEADFMPQSAGAMNMVIPAMMILFYKSLLPDMRTSAAPDMKQSGQFLSITDSRWQKVFHGCLILLGVLMIYGSVIQNIIDQYAMHEGRTATVSMMEQVLDDLNTAEVLDEDSGREIFFIGKPSANPTFGVSPIYKKANANAMVGDFWLSGFNMYASYNALFETVMGIKVPVLCDPYESKAYDEYFTSMPSYPNDGYFVVWDTVIVKISDP